MPVPDVPSFPPALGREANQRASVEFAQALGEALRRARRRRGLTLRAVQTGSRGRFSPSAVGGYERGERAISVVRFCELARLYRTPPDRLLREALDRVEPPVHEQVVVDLTRISLLPYPEQGLTSDLVHGLKSRRGDVAGTVVSLRSGDIEALAIEHDRTPEDLMRTLGPALSGADRPAD